MAEPAIRTFQFGSEAVNLFRGDVDLPLTLFSLPSRNGLDIAVSLLYTSNIHTQATLWNLEAPTGTVGLGWTLPYARIEVDTQGTGSLADNRYFLIIQNNSSPLLRTSAEWFLFSIGLKYTKDLENKKVTTSLQEEFAHNSIPLSSESIITENNALNSWQISDPTYERIYTIYQKENELRVIDGGWGFEQQNYHFWKISYYPEYEKWLIIRENGLMSVYGSGVKENNGCKQSKGNSILWGVRWGNWSGSSTIREGQEQYPLAWNLSGIFSLWGDSVNYTYLSIEQKVGEEGLPYTKECYLKSITDTYERQIIFHYEDKLFVEEKSEGPREFLDPHKYIPNNEPNAYQDRYETKFLDSLEVLNRKGEKLFSMHFDYAIANVTESDPNQRIYGDTCKRFLKGIKQKNVEGTTLPGLEFDYYWNSSDEHPGALKKVVTPLGGTTTYFYEKKTLPLCNRSLKVTHPQKAPQEYWVPRVWFGADYAVVAWYNTDSSILNLNVYTWVGFWYEWQDGPIEFKARLDLDTLNVQTQNEFFFLLFKESGKDSAKSIALHKKRNALGQWTRPKEETSYSTGRLQYQSGENFFIFLDSDNFILYRYTWKWQTQKWDEESFPLSDFTSVPQEECRYYLTAGNNVFLLFAYDLNEERRLNTLKLFYLDDLVQWCEGSTLHPNDVSIAGLNEQSSFYWSLGQTFAVASYITSHGSESIKYEVQIFSWSHDYKFVDSYKSGTLSIHMPIQFVPAVVHNSLIGSGPFLFRYNGNEWQLKQIDLIIPTDPNNLFWFAYGSDFALVTENANTQIVSLLAVYDPNSESLEWKTEPKYLVNTTHVPPYRRMSYFPTAGADFLSLNKDIYYRGFSNNWDSSTQAPIYTIPSIQNVNTTTIFNQSPSFFAYLEQQEDSGTYHPKKTHILDLENGSVKSSESFDEQIFQIYESTGYPKSSLNGRFPFGPHSLYTFPLKDKLDNSKHITIRRYLLGTVNGHINDYRVAFIETDDGYQKSYTSYEYNDETAVCDPSGSVIKYYQVKTYIGCKAKEQAKDGYIETIYINGLPSNIEGINYSSIDEFNNSQENYSVLDGFLDSQNTYNAEGSLVSSQKNDWLVEIKREDQNGNIIPLQGSYVLLRRVTNTREGVTSTTINTYDLSSGQISQGDSTNYNTQGQQEIWSQFYTYGYKEYPILYALNILPAVIQSKTQVHDGKQATIYNVYATRLKKYLKYLKQESVPPLHIYSVYDAFQWTGGEADPNFTYWDIEQEPSLEWKKGSAIIERDNYGIVLEVEDIVGKFASNLYDSNQEYLIASFSNARITCEEAGYLGFEEYEQDQGWKMMPSGGSWLPYVTSSFSHTGEKSLKLSLNTTGHERLQKTFTPNTQDTKYLLTAWYKTEKGFSQMDEIAGWSIILTQQGNELAKFFIPFEETKEGWTYLSQAIDLQTYDKTFPISITISVYNPTVFNVYIDDIRFSPFLSDFSANIYDPRYGLLTASLGPNKETMRNVYNNYQYITATIGPSENVTSISTQYFSRQKENVFHGNLPNAIITISGMDNGFYSNFQLEGSYSPFWETDQKDQWSIEKNTLLHNSNEFGKIQLVHPNIKKCYAAYTLASAHNALTGSLGMSVGDVLTVQWNPPLQKWSLKTKKNEVYSAIQPQGMQKEWLLVIYDKTILFFADGEKLFSILSEENVEGSLALFANDIVDFSEITLSSNPQVTISYADGQGKERQSQILFEGESVISQTVYDELDRPAVNTKSAKLKPEADCPLLSYRPTFVQSLDWDTGIMKGEVSEYYSADGEGFSDDEGYPYSRFLYESSPLSRVIEQGLPGREFAIVDLSTTSPEQRHTLKISYSSNTPNGFMDWLPEGQYYQTLMTDPNGNQAIDIQDQSGNIVGQGNLIDKATQQYNLTSYQNTYSNFGKRITVFLPNYYDPPDPSQKDKWVMQTTYNMIGNIVSSEAPNSGKAEAIYDLTGTLRFSQDEEGRSKGYYLYNKYDSLGRLLENGVIEGAWDPVLLQYYAEHDPSWPSTPSTWSQQFNYDGDGSDPTLMSRLVSVLTHGNLEAEFPANEEVYSYDIAGNVTKYTLTLFKNNESYASTYQYNNQNKLIYAAYASEDLTPTEFYYTYNQGGLLQSIGKTDQEPNSYASYLYYANGTPYIETLRNGAEFNIQRSYHYTSPGWLKEIADPYYKQVMFYTKDSSGQPGYYNGLIAEEEYKFLSTIPENITRHYSYRYSYDNLNCLMSAENKVDGKIISERSIGLNGQPITYDANGNILQIQTGNMLSSYVYNPGTDEVRNTQGEAEESYKYNLNGNTTSAKPKGIEFIAYNRGTSKEEYIQTTTDKIWFEYDGSYRRILKSSSILSRQYIYGISNDPILEKVKELNFPDSSFIYVYGLKGLIGFIKDNAYYFVLTDRQNSTRLIIDEKNITQEVYNYLPYGGFMDGIDEQRKSIPYLYTGQELDEETQLYNYKARFYDSNLGRFYGCDAAGEFASPYTYCANNPIMFIDPSGNISTEAALGIAAGTAIVGAGVALSIATMGAGTPAGVALSIAGATLIGAGVASITYSATHQENWNAREWGINVAIGAGSGLLSGGIGVGIGIGINAAAATMATLSTRTALHIGAGIVSNAAIEAGVNAGAAAVSNEALGTNLSISAAAWQGAALGAATGGLGAASGIKFKMRRTASNSGYRFSNDAKRNLSNLTYYSDDDTRGLTGIFNMQNKRIEMDNFTSAGTPGPYGPAHMQMAQSLYGSSTLPDRNLGISEGPRANYPDLRGCSAVRTEDGRLAFGFGSNSLNMERGGAQISGSKTGSYGRFMSSDDTFTTLMLARYQLNIKPYLLPKYNTRMGHTLPNEEALAAFLRSPYS